MRRRAKEQLPLLLRPFANHAGPKFRKHTVDARARKVQQSVDHLHTSDKKVIETQSKKKQGRL